MNDRTYYIKGMVCERCIQSVKEVLEDLAVPVATIGLGEVTLEAAAPRIEESVLEAKLLPLGFGLRKDKNKDLVANIRKLVREVYSGDFDFPYGFRFSEFAAQRLGKDYPTISMLFTAQEKTTVEKYIMDYRTEKIKELLVYTDYPLSHLAFALGFSSVPHLSKQFKAQTGMTASSFRGLQRSKAGAAKEADTD